MNNVSIVGRFTREMELRYATGENATAILHNCVAVRRKFKNADGEYESDFINVTAFGKTAEFMDQWFKKGDMVGLNGRIQTGSYTNKDGVKVYTTDVVVENVEFVGSKSDNNGDTSNSTANTSNAVNEQELPF
jgi:single-strand DNA-binding protein